jgi:hypothetical protein
VALVVLTVEPSDRYMSMRVEAAPDTRPMYDPAAVDGMDQLSGVPSPVVDDVVFRTRQAIV